MPVHNCAFHLCVLVIFPTHHTHLIVHPASLVPTSWTFDRVCCAKNPRSAAVLAGGARVVQGFSEEPDDKTVVLMEELSQRLPWIWPEGVSPEPRG